MPIGLGRLVPWFLLDAGRPKGTAELCGVLDQAGAVDLAGKGDLVWLETQGGG